MSEAKWEYYESMGRNKTAENGDDEVAEPADDTNNFNHNDGSKGHPYDPTVENFANVRKNLYMAYLYDSVMLYDRGILHIILCPIAYANNRTKNIS